MPHTDPRGHNPTASPDTRAVVDVSCISENCNFEQRHEAATLNRALVLATQTETTYEHPTTREIVQPEDATEPLIIVDVGPEAIDQLEARR